MEGSSGLKNIRFAKDGNQMWVTLTVANPERPDRRVEAEFLVDTGSTGCAITREMMKNLELRKIGQARTKLADGSVRKEDIVWLYLNLNGEHVLTLATVGSCIPLLGFNVMKILGLIIDARGKRIFKPIHMRKVMKILLSKWISTSANGGKPHEHN